MKRGIPKGYKFGPRKMLHGATAGLKRSREYSSWAAMLDRCTSPTNRLWPQYGGRGISIHPSWRDSFAQFLADMGPRPLGTTLDRENNNGNYEPGNCRWATPQQQASNTRRNVYFTLGEETLIAKAWSLRLGCNQSTLVRRRNRGWSDEKVLTTPFEDRGFRALNKQREKTHES